jgi:CBS domain-containing protein
MTISIRQLLEEKGDKIHSISPDVTVYEAIELMAELGIGALLVTENENIVGIFSERDYTRKIVLKNRSSRETAVREIMTENVICMTTDQNIEDCMATMSKHHIRHLPVVEGDKPVGMLSVMDVMRTILSEKEFIISQLENYISGNG